MDDYRELYRTGPDTVSGQYMRTFWHPVYSEEDLKPGWAKPIQIMGEKFTLYRGESGTPHLVAFQCAHRGMQLSAGWVEDDCLRCRYHGWKYDGTGQCVEMPTEDETTANTVRIRSYPVREYIGLIFAYLGKGEPPPFPRYPEFEKEGTSWIAKYTRPCNFVNNLENDPVHIPFVHKESEIYRFRRWEVPVRVRAEETEWGIALYSIFADERESILLRGWPNIGAFKSADRDHIAWRVPIDDEHHESFQVDLMHKTVGEEGYTFERRQAARIGKLGRSYVELAEAVLRGEMRIQDLEGDDTANFIWLQDYVVQVGMGSFADRRSERLIRSDVGVLLHRKMWERELSAFAEGRSLKKWTYSGQIAASFRPQPPPDTIPR